MPSKPSISEQNIPKLLSLNFHFLLPITYNKTHCKLGYLAMDCNCTTIHPTIAISTIARATIVKIAT
jgi:hypothetical protein